jgi:hypothetical protein
LSVILCAFFVLRFDHGSDAFQFRLPGRFGIGMLLQYHNSISAAWRHLFRQHRLDSVTATL